MHKVSSVVASGPGFSPQQRPQRLRSERYPMNSLHVTFEMHHICQNYAIGLTMRMHAVDPLMSWSVTEVLFGMIHHLRRPAVRKEMAVIR